MWAQPMRRTLLSKYFLPPRQHPLAVNRGCLRGAGYPLSPGSWGDRAPGRRMLRLKRKQEVRQRQGSTENTASSQGGEGVTQEGFQGEATQRQLREPGEGTDWVRGWGSRREVGVVLRRGSYRS